jgi:uncharacterized protein (DUF488 family)
LTIFTIGFTKKSAEKFFGLLNDSGAARLVDVRLHNVSQLAGFAKRDDLAYFLRKICDMEYMAEPLLAPTPAMLDRYRKEKGGWLRYEREFLDLLESRQVERTLSKNLVSNSVLLCSEDSPERCHRRLVAEYLKSRWGPPLEIRHLR